MKLNLKRLIPIFVFILVFLLSACGGEATPAQVIPSKTKVIPVTVNYSVDPLMATMLKKVVVPESNSYEMNLTQDENGLYFENLDYNAHVQEYPQKPDVKLFMVTTKVDLKLNSENCSFAWSEINSKNGADCFSEVKHLTNNVTYYLYDWNLNESGYPHFNDDHFDIVMYDHTMSLTVSGVVSTDDRETIAQFLQYYGYDPSYLPDTINSGSNSLVKLSPMDKQK